MLWRWRVSEKRHSLGTAMETLSTRGRFGPPGLTFHMERRPLNFRLPCFKSQFTTYCASYLVSLCLSFLVGKTGRIVIAPLCWGWGDYEMS